MSAPRSRVPARRAARLVRTGGLAAGVLVLSAGCALRPGIAAQVDEETIDSGRVDDITAAVCEVEGPTYTSPLPLAALKGLVLQTLVDEQLAAEVAETYDVGPGSDFGDQQREFAAQVADQPEDVRDGYLAVLRAASYAQAIFTAAATEQLTSDGEDPADPAALERTVQGIRALAARDADIEISPRFGLAYVDGRLTADESGSVPASDSAIAAAASLSGDQAADPGYAASLPADQVCGG